MTANDNATPETSALRRDSRWNVFWNQVAITISAKNPSTTDGIPASSSTTGLTISRVRAPAYCETYTAAPTPSGTETAIATIVTLIVPRMSGQMPNFGMSETGCHIDPDSSYPGHSWGIHIFPRVTSSRTTLLYRIGAASLAVNTRIRTIATIAEIASACSSHSA